MNNPLIQMQEGKLQKMMCEVYKKENKDLREFKPAGVRMSARVKTDSFNQKRRINTNRRQE